MPMKRHGLFVLRSMPVEICCGVRSAEVCSIEEVNTEPFYIQKTEGELLNYILGMPSKYRDVLYLFYYEGYTAVEIAGIMGRKENTIYTWLDRARKALREQLGGEPIGE